jgi:hypothetical protein
MIAQLTGYPNTAFDRDISANMWSNHPMMMGWGGNGIWIYSILSLITWTLLIAVLFALLRWLWKKGDPERGRR